MTAADQAIEVLPRAERALGPTVALTTIRVQALARLGTDQAGKQIRDIAAAVPSLPEAEQPDLIRELAKVFLGLGGGRRSMLLMADLAERRPKDLQIQLETLDLATLLGDLGPVPGIVARLRDLEGERGATWRYADAVYRLGQARSGDSKASLLARRRITEIEELQPQWWAASLLRGNLAESENRLEDAVKGCSEN